MCMTPFGFPVVPLVMQITATVSGASAGGVNAAISLRSESPKWTAGADPTGHRPGNSVWAPDTPEGAPQRMSSVVSQPSSFSIACVHHGTTLRISAPGSSAIFATNSAAVASPAVPSVSSTRCGFVARVTATSSPIGMSGSRITAAAPLRWQPRIARVYSTPLLQKTPTRADGPMPCLAVATAKQTACSYAWLKVSVSWPDAQSPGLFSDLRKWLDVTPFIVAARSAAIVGGGADGRGWIRGASSGATRVELIVEFWDGTVCKALRTSGSARPHYGLLASGTPPVFYVSKT